MNQIIGDQKQKAKNKLALVISFLGFIIMLSGFWNPHLQWWLYGIGLVLMFVPLFFLYKDTKIVEEEKDDLSTN